MVAETEALGADRLRAIVRDELDALLPRPLDSFRGRERTERGEVLDRLRGDDDDDDEDGAE